MSDTIAAIATAPGRGAIGLVRLSGPRATEIAQAIAGPLPPPRQAGLRAFRDRSGQILDRGLLLRFVAPQSYTGEDLVELQAHGGPVLLDLLLRTACEYGARIARPGEFSERAFVNGRIDLAQAEAVADLIDAASREAVTAAQRSLDGEFSERVRGLADQLTALRVWVEGALDFSDEDIDWLADTQLHHRFDDWLASLRQLQQLTRQGRRLREGLVVAIAGQPNVGKSSLLNRLAGADVAIVSDQPGTTRDLLREHLLIDGLPLTVVDTAGLRDTDDRVEQEGIRRAWSVLERAEAVLFVSDDRVADDPLDQELLTRLPQAAQVLRLRNKCDLSGEPAARLESELGITLRLSAATGEGIDLLRQELLQVAGWNGAGGESQGLFTARTRHVQALDSARLHAESAAAGLRQSLAADVVAEELRLAQQALGEITGAVSSDDLLGHIFSSFCIGK